MLVVAKLLLVLAAALASFAYWGIYTPDGQHAFDEMAGIIPFWAGLMSILLALGAALAFWLDRRRIRGGKP